MCHDAQLFRRNQEWPSSGRSHPTTGLHSWAIGTPEATPSGPWKARLPDNEVPVQKTKSILVGRNIEVNVRTSDPGIMLLCIPTRADMNRISGNIHVCASPPMSIASRPQPSAPTCFTRTRTSIPTPTHPTSRHTFAYYFLGFFGGWPLWSIFAVFSDRRRLGFSTSPSIGSS